MKFNRREAQRARITQLHDHRDLPAATVHPVTDVAALTRPVAGWWDHLHQQFHQWWIQREEPRITAITDTSGHLYWRAYNPRTQELTWLSSDTEVMLWLSSQPWF